MFFSLKVNKNPHFFFFSPALKIPCGSFEIYTEHNCNKITCAGILHTQKKAWLTILVQSFLLSSPETVQCLQTVDMEKIYC